MSRGLSRSERATSTATATGSSRCATGRRRPRRPQLRALHDEIPEAPGPLAARHRGLLRDRSVSSPASSLWAGQWLYNDHGQRTLAWDDHCNRAYTRWILREHGIVLTGPEPRSFMPPVPADALRAESSAADPDPDAGPRDVARYRRAGVGTALRRGHGLPAAVHDRDRAGRQQGAARSSGRSAPSTRDGDRSSARSATTAQLGWDHERAATTRQR